MRHSDIPSRTAPIGALAIGLLALAGCASDVPRPTEQLAVSQAAINEAETAQAVRYAPIPLQSARDKLNRAQAASADGDFLEARRLAAEAEVDAQLAEITAHNETAQEAVAQLQESIETLRQEMQRRDGG